MKGMPADHNATDANVQEPQSTNTPGSRGSDVARHHAMGVQTQEQDFAAVCTVVGRRT
jgi:hypothetical protein